MLVLLRLLNSPPTRKEFISSQNFKTTEPLQDNETQVNFRTDYSIHKAIRYPPQHHDCQVRKWPTEATWTRNQHGQSNR